MNKLRGLRAYLCGPIEAGGGGDWRRDMTRFLQAKGVEVFDPCNKPFAEAFETPETMKNLLQWRREGRHDEVRQFMRAVRHVDLRMVDLCDFLVGHFHRDTSGTHEELAVANRSKKPIVLQVAEGWAGSPLWFFGMLPPESVYSEWAEVRKYLERVDAGKESDLKRWLFPRSSWPRSSWPWPPAGAEAVYSPDDFLD